MFSNIILGKAENILEACRRRTWRLATAESCTGGLVAGCLTAIAGSSDVVERGFVTYSNRAKHELLGVPEDLLIRVGAVSEEVARAMATGALKAAPVQLAVAITGIAGPGGGTPAKPVGLVHFAAATTGGLLLHRRMVFPGDRTAVRLASVETALDLLSEALG